MPRLATTSAWPVSLDPRCFEGHLVRLEPLARKHDAELAGLCADERIWQYLNSFGGSPEAMRVYLDSARRERQAGSALPFVLRSVESERVIGMTRLKELSAEHRRAVVGSWLVPAAWGTGANTESKLLLLGYAFETLRCLRVEFHADSLNGRSRAALTRLGAVEEGTLRSYVTRRDGSRRDTVMFSVLAAEWPRVRETLRARLDAQAGGRR